MRRQCALLLISVFVAALSASCGAEVDSSTSAGGAITAGSPPKPAALEGSFDVGGYKLCLKCSGTGSPTVVYLHGYIEDPSGGGSTNSGEIPGLLDDRYRVCIYDRANVGRSDSTTGPLTGISSVKDLHALLSAAGVRGPYVMLGASFGGLIADMYAATYPDDVIGMVLLDASLPRDLDIDTRFVPKSERLKPDDWKHATEKLDRLAAYRQARALEGNEPRIPVTYIATKKLDLLPSVQAESMTLAIRKEQQAFVDRFSPGRLILVDAPHYMEPVIPDRIASEVKRVIDAAKK